jgi:dihydroorotase
VIPKIAERYPNLKIIIEHISTKEAVEMVKKYPNVYA